MTDIAIAVVEQHGRYLIGLRPAGVPLAGYWEFPGGKVRPGESPPLAAARECREETGLAVEVQGLLGVVDHAYPHGQVRLHFFACKPRLPETTIASRFRWVPASELAQYRFPPANDSLLARLAADAPWAP